MNPHAFPNLTTGGDEKIQPRERPEGGHTEVITAFHSDHPEFRQINGKVQDTNTLKFNHAVHMGKGNMPRQLNCADCHEQDGRGEYQLPIKSCVDCHSPQGGIDHHMVSTEPLFSNNRHGAISAAILRTGEVTWFFKIAGEAGMVAAQRAKFVEFVRSAEVR